MRDIHPRRLKRLHDFFNGTVVGDVDTSLSSSKPVNDERDGYRQLLARVFVDRADVIALLQFGEFLLQFGLHYCAGEARMYVRLRSLLAAEVAHDSRVRPPPSGRMQ